MKRTFLLAWCRSLCKHESIRSSDAIAYCMYHLFGGDYHPLLHVHIVLFRGSKQAMYTYHELFTK